MLKKAIKKTKRVSTTNAVRHFSKAHPDSAIAKKHQRGVDSRKNHRNAVAADSLVGAGAAAPPDGPSGTQKCPTCNGPWRVPVVVRAPAPMNADTIRCKELRQEAYHKLKTWIAVAGQNK